MPLAVLPALVEDIPRVYDVQFAAFRDEPIMRFLYPHGVDRELHTKATAEWWNHDRVGHTVKCVDTDTGAVVGMATWDIYWRPGPENAYRKPDGIPWLEGDDKARCERILAPMWDMRVRLFGKRRYIYLSTIAVDPEHQRKGIGRKLMQWGADVADQLELPVYTEASETGFSLYSSVGFERLTHVRLVHSAEARGEDEAAEVPLVVRMPKAAGGISFEQWSDAGFPKDFNVHGNGTSE